mmetsp:Transcript_13248/g.33155  ORF Transcript_13248/g.33155 Transcript_13248/m.33155 type:complete len:251 (+) Transcript_13248:185-937(+)
MASPQQQGYFAAHNVRSAGMGPSSPSDQLHVSLHLMPRAHSMDVDNDPRFSAPTVLSKRLGAFYIISIAAVFFLNLAVGQMFFLMPSINLETYQGIASLVGTLFMCSVFIAHLCAIVVFAQQLYMTYRLETSGPSGFEMAKSFYLNPNVVTMRHVAVKCFLHYGIPVFVASTSCMVFTHMLDHGLFRLAIPVCTLFFAVTFLLVFINQTHTSIFMDKYHMVTAQQAPLNEHMYTYSSRPRAGGWFGNLDI